MMKSIRRDAAEIKHITLYEIIEFGVNSEPDITHMFTDYFAASMKMQDLTHSGVKTTFRKEEKVPVVVSMHGDIYRLGVRIACSDL